jgi:two-component sensor histidine kinase
LVTNSIKHAFTNSANDLDNTISISLREFSAANKAEYIELTYADNGKGIPEGIDLRDNKRSFGFSSLIELVELQLDGNIEIQSSKTGTEVTIKFPKFYLEGQY